jgi:uncharacterized RDD family membrane protein YckC
VAAGSGGTGVARNTRRVARAGSLAIRISDADRHEAERRLRDACAEGRLSVDELTNRLDRAYSARTAADLEPLFRDLPRVRQRGTYAPVMDRTVGFVVDELLLVGASAVAAAELGSWLVFAALIPILHLVYYTLLHGSRHGQTIGNRFAKTAVRTTDGGRLTYSQAFGRTIMKFAAIAFWFVGGVLDFLFPLWDRRRQALHDKAAGTVVVTRR